MKITDVECIVLLQPEADAEACSSAHKISREIRNSERRMYR